MGPFFLYSLMVQGFSVPSVLAPDSMNITF